MNPKYAVGDQLKHISSDVVFRIEAVKTLKPDDRIGYEMVALGNFKIHLFEGELEGHFEQVKGG